MFSRFHHLLSALLNQTPTLLSLAVLAAVGWWGYVWDWKIPSLTDLLHPSAAKKPEESKKQEDDKKEPQSPDKLPPLIRIASEEKMTAAGIKTAAVEEKLIPEYVKAHGHVEFNQNHYAHLSTRARGTAWRVEKHAGDEVKKGDVLALVAAPEVATLKFDLEQTLLTIHTRQQIVKLRKAAGKVTTGLELENAEASLREARIHLSNNRQSLQNLGLTLDTDELFSLTDAEITARLRTLGIPDSLLQRLDVKTLANNLLPMYAPFDGEIIKRDIVIGEAVNPGTPQFVLADLRQLWIMLHVHPEDARKLALGQTVLFHLDGINEDAPPARIAWISAEVDEKTRTVSVRADVPNDKARLRPGTFGDGRILVNQQNRLIVPNTALQFDGKSHFVFMQGESTTEFQPVIVDLGPRYEEQTVISSGLKAGQKIAIVGSHELLAEMLKDRIGGED